jgi:asparagine synthase (glutamine-hydrolysing)
MKTLLNLSKNIKMFNPGQVYINGEFFTHYMPLWKTIDYVPNGKLVYKEIKDKLIDSITSQILNDKPLGILLSGGFNSSILTIILNNLKMKGIIKNELNTFTIGLESNNIPHTTEAEKLSELLNIEHNVYNYTIEDVMDILEDLIYYLEVYDVTTIRSAIPYYLLSMQIQEDPEIKQVISGDIANELFINNSNILPSCSIQKNNIKKDKLQKDIVSNISNIYNTTLLRSHKTTMACSLKSILPFGDRDLIDYIMNIDPKYKMTNKESILKKTFYDECNEINYNVDELQSISLSKNDLLINELISNIDNIITDDEFNNKSKIIATTKEEYYYKKIYNKYYVLE